MTQTFDALPEIAAFRRRVRAALERCTPREVFETFTAENDAAILQPDLEDGGRIVAERAAIHVELVRHWAAAEQKRHGYDKPFAVVAVGGTGRFEVTPRSDLDFALLVDDAVEENDFLAGLQTRVLHTNAFFADYGFRFEPLPFNLDDVPGLSGMQLNSFLDLAPVYGAGDLAARFLDRIRATYDPFEHFLFLRGDWIGRRSKAAAGAESLDAFDIKHDALRVFLAGVWMLAGKDFRHSREIYARLEDPRDLAAYQFLLRVRCFVHARRGTAERAAAPGEHVEDRLRFEDFTSFGDWLGAEADEGTRFDFANEVRARLLAARRRVARFATAVLARELTPGRAVGPESPLVYRLAGLAHSAPERRTTPASRSREALGLVLAAQHYEVPVDPAEIESTFRDAGDWLEPTPELGALFYEPRGSLAASFEFLAQFDGALERLFPGYARFETSIDARVMQERTCLRGVIGRRKLEMLEGFVAAGRDALHRAVSASRPAEPGDKLDPAIEAALLSADDLAAVKLALITKRLPLTDEDVRRRDDPRLALHERRASGFSEIPVESYYERYRARCEFSDRTLALTAFLVTHRREFKGRAETGLNDDEHVREFAALCGDEQTARSLFVFTCVDRAEWEHREQEPARWFRIDELYTKALRALRPGTDPKQHLRNLGFSPEELEILEDLGADFFSGLYGDYARRFGAHLLRLAEEPGPAKAMLLRSGASRIVGVAARDFRGLAACIAGELWQRGLNLQQAHLFSATSHGLALDFFHLAPSAQPLDEDLLRGVEAAIGERRHIGDPAPEGMPGLESGETTLQQRRPKLYLLRHETKTDASGLVYALAYRVYRHLGANIFALDAQTTRHGVFVSIYLDLPEGMDLGQAQAIVRERFR